MLSDYAFYKKLIIDSSKIGSDLSHFPVAIPLGVSVGLTDADVTDIFDEVGADYLKIAVFMADETTELYVEVEQWAAVNEKGLLWVSRDTWTIASASDTEIYLAFDSTVADNTAFVGTPGNRTEVWNSDFAAAYTLAQDPSGGAGCIIDSAGNGNHGTPVGSMTSADLVDALIGKGLEFDDVDDYINLGDIDLPGSYHISALYYHDGTPTQLHHLVAKESSYTLKSYQSGNARAQIYDGSWYTAEDTAGSNSAWHVLDSRLDGSTLYLYLDGVQIATALANTPQSNNNPTMIGTWNGNTFSFKGTIAAVFITFGTSRSAAWVKANSHNLTDNVLTFGATQSSGVTTEIADISLDLAAYYQARSDLAAMLAATDGTVLQDLTAALQTYGQSVDDLPAALAAYFQDRQDLAAHLTTWAAGRQDLPAALRAMGLGRDNLPAHLQTVAWSGRDLATVLAAVTPLVFRDLGLSLTATDGTMIQNLAMAMAAVKRAPQYRSVVAQRISSVISEVS